MVWEQYVCTLLHAERQKHVDINKRPFICLNVPVIRCTPYIYIYSIGMQMTQVAVYQSTFCVSAAMSRMGIELVEAWMYIIPDIIFLISSITFIHRRKIDSQTPAEQECVLRAD